MISDYNDYAFLYRRLAGGPDMGRWFRHPAGPYAHEHAAVIRTAPLGRHRAASYGLARVSTLLAVYRFAGIAVLAYPVDARLRTEYEPSFVWMCWPLHVRVT